MRRRSLRFFSTSVAAGKNSASGAVRQNASRGIFVSSGWCRSVPFDSTIFSVRVGSGRFGSVRFGSVRSGSARLGSVRFGMVPFRSGGTGSVPLRSVRFRSVRFRSVPFGSVRFRSVPRGLVLRKGLVERGSPLSRHTHCFASYGLRERLRKAKAVRSAIIACGLESLLGHWGSKAV